MTLDNLNIALINKIERSMNKNDLLNVINHSEIEKQVVKQRNISNTINQLSINKQKPLVLYHHLNLLDNNYYTPENIQIRTEKLNKIKKKYLGDQSDCLDSSI